MNTAMETVNCVFKIWVAVFRFYDWCVPAVHVLHTDRQRGSCMLKWQVSLVEFQ